MNNLIDLTENQATRQPEKIAFSILADGKNPSQHLSFGELAWYARCLATRFQYEKLEGKCALLLYPTGIDYIVAFLACLYAGIIAVPAYPPDPLRLDRSLRRLKNIILDANPSICLTSNELQRIFVSILDNNDSIPPLRWLSTDHMDSFNDNHWNRPQVSGQSLAYLQYTSGSTQNPKGVMITHENTLTNLSLGQALNHFSKESRIVGWVPLYHDLGLIAYVIGTIFNGCHCYLMSPHHFLQNPFRWLYAISRFRATHNAAPPFGYELCVSKIDSEKRQHLDLSCWTVAGIGAEKVQKDTIDRFSKAFNDVGFQKKAFFPTYGMAEAVLYISGGKSPCYYEQSSSQKHILPQKHPYITSCGWTDTNHRIIVVDPETHKKCGTKTIGEIWLQGPSVAAGYYLKPDISKKIFEAYVSDTHEGPFLRTGDLGFIDNDMIFITGRLKDVIIINGQNYYPEDIEFSIQECHPLIRTGAIAAFSIEMDASEKMVIVCETRPISQENPINGIISEINRIIFRNFSMIPDIIALISARTLPKTSSGKIQRNLCKQNFQQQKLNIVHLWERHSNDLEIGDINSLIENDRQENFQKLINAVSRYIISKVCEISCVSEKDIGDQTTYSELLLDSIGLTQLMNDIEHTFHITLSSELLKPSTTFKQLSFQIATELWK